MSKKTNAIFLPSLYLLIFLYGSLSVSACEFEFSRKSQDLEGSLAGVEDVILVKITKNHRRCDFDFNDAKFKGEGLTILAATPWKEEKGGVFARKIKVVYDQGVNVRTDAHCRSGGRWKHLSVPG